jgi:large subunit ribosomal protein L21
VCQSYSWRYAENALTFKSDSWYNLLFGGPAIYAIIETGGKQYRVSPGQVIEVDFLDEIDGSKIEIDRVLLVGDGDKTLTGTPVVEGAKVTATSQGEVKGDKVTSFRYKNKTRFHRKMGHHQTYTRIAIDEIVGPGETEKKPVRKSSAKKEVTEDGA